MTHRHRFEPWRGEGCFEPDCPTHRRRGVVTAAELYPCDSGARLHVAPCSSANNCLHATADDHGMVLTCDSDPGVVLHATAAEWKAFVGRIRADLAADIDALLPAARLYLQALDADPENEWLTLPEAFLVSQLRDAVARHTDAAEPAVGTAQTGGEQ